jgi:hypothetical protein
MYTPEVVISELEVGTAAVTADAVNPATSAQASLVAPVVADAIAATYTAGVLAVPIVETDAAPISGFAEVPVVSSADADVTEVRPSININGVRPGGCINRPLSTLSSELINTLAGDSLEVRQWT